MVFLPFQTFKRSTNALTMGTNSDDWSYWSHFGTNVFKPIVILIHILFIGCFD